MGNYSVPENIRKQKPRGSMVKLIHGKYYVYEYFHVKDNDSGKWKTKMGSLIGSIDPALGFIPNDSIRKDEITSVDFGEYFLSLSLSNDVLNKLCLVFNKSDAYTIYLLSLIHFVNGFTHIKDVDSLFKQSYLSIKYSSISLSDKIISNLYDNLGRKQERVNKFEDLLIEESSKELAFDGHVIANNSDDNSLAEKGNKANILKNNQINVLMAYDINTNKPILSRVYSGGTLDKVAIKDLIERKNLNSILFIVDKGFYSSEVIGALSTNDNHYIIPLYESHKPYKKIVSTNIMEGLFIFERSKKRSTIEYHEEIINNKRVIFYRDLSLNALEATDYLSKVESGKYTKESYLEKKDMFGTIVLETNLYENTSPEKIYRYYKSRWSIETFYDYYKNRLDVNSLFLDNYYKTQGLSFVMLVTSLIYSEFKKNLKQLKIKESTQSILLDARFLKLHKNSNHIWKVENINSKHLQIFEDFNLNVTEEAMNISSK